jgi:hypothetical protein
MKKAPKRSRTDGPILHSGLTLVETAESEFLDELAADPRFGAWLVARLSDRVAVVAPGYADRVVKALVKAGHTPKVLE